MNLFSIPQRKDDEFCETIAYGHNCRIERIVSQGHRSPDDFWYDQSEDELVYLLSGNAILDFQNCCVFLTAGDTIFIPAHKKHRVDQTSSMPPCVWLCVFGKLNHNK